ncbi:MAG: polysaccharide deacetylase family protein [Spirochaetes bacterium]|jgi:peptidoglycan/xylan/chitin deacetylase (PgdA/CDA1 family)|nr:polysaccharide deacetylase family protein [Spirochaetota bacterium]
MKKLFLLAVITIMISSCTKKDIDPQTGEPYPKADKLCALTFDDGPSADAELTPQVLDTLEKHNVPATFFLVGQNFDDSTKDIVKRMVSLGHEIGNHSWTYDGMQNMSEKQVKKYINDTTAIIEEYAGVTPKFFRAPNLSASNTMYEVIDLPFASGVLGFDWPGGGGDTAELVVEKVMSGMKDGAIILLHDVQPKPHPTPEAIDVIIPKLKREGYEFVTLSELFERKGVTPDSSSEMMYVYVE